MVTFSIRYRRHFTPTRFISRDFRKLFPKAVLFRKRSKQDIIRWRRKHLGVIYCLESSSSNDQAVSKEDQEQENLTKKQQHREVAIDPNTKTVSSSESKATWLSLIPFKIRVFWAHSLSAEFVKESFGLLRKNLWTLMSLTAMNSAARFLLVWSLYKTVCLVAITIFKIPPTSIPQQMIPTSESLGDPDVYQQLADITFLLFKPFDFLLRGFFIAAGLITCWDSVNIQPVTPKGRKRFQFVRTVWNGFLASFDVLWRSMKKSKDYMIVYIVAGSLTALYQGLTLLIIPILYALRRLMNIQLAVCSMLFLGKSITPILHPTPFLDKQGRQAFHESEKLVQPVRRHLYFPYLLLFLAPKFLGIVRDLVVKVFPDRLFAEVPEITWGLIACTTVTAFLIDRMADILPVVIFSSSALQAHITKQDKEKNEERPRDNGSYVTSKQK